MASDTATLQAYREIYGMIERQAAVLSYVDIFGMMVIVCFAIIPLIFVAKRPQPDQASPHP